MSGELLSYEDAHARVASFARELLRVEPPQEKVALTNSLGRVLAEPIKADLDQPAFSRSTRDGFACRAAEISVHVPLRVGGTIQAGESSVAPLAPGCAWEIMTGAPVPKGADAVVMLEHVKREGKRIWLASDRSIRPGENLVEAGAQARRGELLLSAGATIGPAQVALCAACGYAILTVYRPPRVAILTTGDELVGLEEQPGPGQIRNSNAVMLAALVARSGGEPVILPRAADSPEALDAALDAAIDADLLLISGGVSAGRFDLVEPALARRGAIFHFTGVRIQPGKPLVFGEVLRATEPSIPFFGLPGNPISSAATFLLFASQVVKARAGRGDFGPQFLSAELARDTDRKGKAGLTRFLPAWCDFAAGGGSAPQVATVPWNGSSDLPAFARSNCLVVVPEDVKNLEAGAIVRILML